MGPCEFNSKLALDVYVCLPDARAELFGTTRAEGPVSIPKCRWWGVAPGIETGTVHGFRHTFVTMFANKNLHPLKLIKWAGHKHLETTLIYCHDDDEALQRAMASVSFEESAGSDGTGSKQAQNVTPQPSGVLTRHLYCEKR